MTFVPDQPCPEHVDLPRFLLEAAHRRAESVVSGVERITLSERNSLRVMERLDNPPEPNARLLAAARLRLERV